MIDSPLVLFMTQVDGDSSTNDTVIALASGLSSAPAVTSLEEENGKKLQEALDAVQHKIFFSFNTFSL